MNMNKNEENEQEVKEVPLEEYEETKLEEDLVRDSLKAKDEEIAELNNKLIRLQADFVNYRKRAEKEKENSILYGIESFACDLLPIIDNFQRAIDSEVDKESPFYKGISMIEQQLKELLKNNSIEEVQSLGQPFDPNFHHAVFMEESKDYDSGIIIEILQKGYQLKDKVIRPSMVKVSK